MIEQARVVEQTPWCSISSAPFCWAIYGRSICHAGILAYHATPRDLRNQRGQVYHQSIDVIQRSAEDATMLDLTPLVFSGRCGDCSGTGTRPQCPASPGRAWRRPPTPWLSIDRAFDRLHRSSANARENQCVPGSFPFGPMTISTSRPENSIPRCPSSKDRPKSRCCRSARTCI